MLTMATIHVDGKEYEVDGADNLLQACLSLGLDIPYFCWHPALGSVGACRQCAVKQYQNAEDTRGRLVMSCMTPASDGTFISIDDGEAKQFRESVVEWLMTNHPHDCPVCEEGGNCHLQDMTVMTGHSFRRYRFTKRTHNNQELGPFISHEMNRCIACYRCVRYYKDYADGTDFGVYGAHDNVYFGRPESGTLESEFSGNLVEVCPTGVFTDKTHSERYNRKWDMQFAPSICQQCSIGCNTSPGERYGELRRIENRYNGSVNHYFLCDRGRFGYGYVNQKDRPRQPQQLRGDDWIQGYRVVATYPHDPEAYTQGLLFDGSVLRESTGRRGTSTVRTVELIFSELRDRRVVSPETHHRIRHFTSSMLRKLQKDYPLTVAGSIEKLRDLKADALELCTTDLLALRHVVGDEQMESLLYWIEAPLTRIEALKEEWRLFSGLDDLHTGSWTLGEIATLPMFSSVVADLAPRGMRGRYQGVYAATSWGLASFAGPLAGGAMLISFTALSLAFVVYGATATDTKLLSYGAWSTAHERGVAIEFLVDRLSLAFAALSAAIAGVVNVVLKEGRFTPFLNASVGGYTPGDYPDDGNTIDDDTCSNSCRINNPP